MKIKICGITNAADAACAVEYGADLLGFIFYPKSPRYVAPEVVAEIIAGLSRPVDTVGVFVNEPVEELLRIGRLAGLTALQLHGNETAEIFPQLTEFKLMKAVGLATDQDFDKLEQYPGATMLIDTPCPEYGGSGEVGDWLLAERAARQCDLFLAGGLTPNNVSSAVTSVRPYGIDVASGTEREKGLKDHEKVRLFIERARHAEQEIN